MSPERIFVSENMEGERSEGSVPEKRWADYARKVFAGITLYDTYQNLPLHRQEVINAVSFARERVKGNPERVFVLGSGQNSIEISSLHKNFGEPEIIAVDIQTKFLETLMKRLSRNNKKAFNQTYPLLMNIGKPWVTPASNDGKEIKLDSLPFVFCNIVFNWLTEEEQAGVFKNVSERLSPNGDFILATLTNNWDSDEVRKHIPEQLRKSPLWTILGAVGARRWADKVAREFPNVHRPSINDIYKLAEGSGLEVKSIDEDRIFWRTENGDPTAVVAHLKKK